MLELLILTLLNYHQAPSLNGAVPSLEATLNLIEPSRVPSQKEATQKPALFDDENLAVWTADIDSGKTLFTQKAHRPQPIASLTKIMTFLIIYQDHDLDEVVTVTPQAARTEGAQVDLYEYEKLTVRTLLEAILIPSANDAAKALAIHHSGSEEVFAKVMNQRAKKWGLKTAQFYNATGLDFKLESKHALKSGKMDEIRGNESKDLGSRTEDVRRVSFGEDDEEVRHFPDFKWVGNMMSAYEVALLTKRALQIPFFRETVQKESFFGTSVDEKFAHTKKSTNKLLGSFLGSKGVKTGYTELAGQCLVHLSQREDGVQILSVVLGSPDRFQETKNILTWIWDSFVWK